LSLFAHLGFISSPPETSLLLMGTYDPALVLLSIAIAVFAAYAALGVAARISLSAAGREKWFWTGMGALTMGGGVWAMHFIGMLAFSLPCAVSYDRSVTLLSMLPSILASGVALRIISRPSLTRGALLSGGLLLGAGIGAMHYTGMAAYRLDGLVRYDPTLFWVSIVVAVGLAILALWVRARLNQWIGRWVKLSPRHLDILCALVMGGAVSGMHYTAMAAAYFISDGRPGIPDSGLTPTFLALSISVVATLLIALVLATTLAYRQRDLARRVQASEQRVRRILETTQEGFIMLDRDGVLVEANPAFARMMGATAEHLVGHPLLDFTRGHHQQQLVDELRRHHRGEQSRYEIELTRPDGTDLPCKISATPILDDQGGVSGGFALVSDLSSRKRHEAYVRQVLAMFENTADGVLMTDARGNIVSVNPAFTKITGYSEVEALGKNPRFLQSERHDQAFYQQLWAQASSINHWQGEIWNRRKNGEVYPEWLTISVVKDEAGQVQSYVGVFSDISHIKRSEEKLERMAHYDPLTDLPNRALLGAHLAHALDRAARKREKLAVMVLDLDGFKNVNDSLGHPAGDLLLQKIAGRLQESLRQEDTVARMGGDEFAIIVESLGPGADPGKIAEKMIQVVSAPVDLQGHGALVTASVGIALYPDDGPDATALLKAADTAMYASKQAGRNTLHFHHPDMARAAHQRLSLEHGLRRAIDNGELEVWYQPQFTLASNRLIGAEALVRWRDPQHGPIPPIGFIPLAEETGLILPLGEWVLRQTCLNAHRWLGQGLDCGNLSVNVADLQIQRGDFCATVQQVLAETGLEARRLVLEITESFLLHNADQAMTVVTKLNGLGVKVAIDDFGTGHSSLSYLKYLRADKLKIDQQFIRDLPDDHDDAAITRAVIALGHSLGFKIIAEGVETEAQREFLRSEGCEEAQGYFYSKPLPAAEFEQFLRQQAEA
jgi:diguanylate cyclase (GGDEF)-like protein/PAS domain S-box-containing protein